MYFIKKIIYPLLLFSLLSCWYVNEEEISENDSIDVETFLSTPQSEENIETPPTIDTSLEKGREKINQENKNIDLNNTEIIVEETNKPDEDIELEDLTIEIEDIITEDEIDKEAEIIEETTQEDIEELINILFETSTE
jgi:hypothetical protein